MAVLETQVPRAADHIRDLFGRSLPDAVTRTVLFALSAWAWSEGLRFVSSQEPRHFHLLPPFTWWSEQIGQAQLIYPKWLTDLINWDVPNRTQMLTVLVLLLISSQIRGRQGNPGYHLVAMLAFAFGAEWFGTWALIRAMLYMTAPLVIVAAAVALVNRNRTGRVRFTGYSIWLGVIDGPLAILVELVVFPAKVILGAVETFAVPEWQERNPVHDALATTFRLSDSSDETLRPTPFEVQLAVHLAAADQDARGVRFPPASPEKHQLKGAGISQDTEIGPRSPHSGPRMTTPSGARSVTVTLRSVTVTFRGPLRSDGVTGSDWRDAASGDVGLGRDCRHVAQRHAA